MMGTKERTFAPLVAVSLEALVPQDHFYRHLQRTLDLSFVHEFVQDTYASSGRPSVDPEVFFKLHLVMFFEGIRSERLLMRHAADRLSVRWYIGDDLNEPLPDHSSLTRIRTRYGLEVFRRFFDAILEQCRQAKLIWGKEMYFDATQVKANAALDSLDGALCGGGALGGTLRDRGSGGGSKSGRQARPDAILRDGHTTHPTSCPA